MLNHHDDDAISFALIKLQLVINIDVKIEGKKGTRFDEKLMSHKFMEANFITKTRPQFILLATQSLFCTVIV